jgi:hypothetical protein
MNCKQGDLAIIVRSVAGNEGKIVRCLRLVPWGHDGGRKFEGPRWIVDRPLPASRGLPITSVADFSMRPIRGVEGEDAAHRTSVAAGACLRPNV